MTEYRVNLDAYNGPLDLLLYLIRRDEVDIWNIPIASITEQYVKYVEMLKEIDPNLAGEFLVMAATLIEIKSRLLLPVPPPEEGQQEGVTIDPRAELVRQLLEYKAFKDAAGDLATSAAVQAQKFPRRPPLPNDGGKDLDMEDVQVWDLLEAFSKLMASIGQQARQTDVIYDDTPLNLHIDDILDRLQREGAMTFRQIFEGRTKRTEIVGLFLAVLEMIRLKRIVASQDAAFGEIFIHLLAPADGAGQPDAQQEAPIAEPAGSAAGNQDNAFDDTKVLETASDGSADGQYASDYPQDPPPQDDDHEQDDGDAEAQGTGA